MESSPELATQLAELRALVADLSARLDSLAAAQQPAPPIDEETLIAISAAVAAYLGKRAPVRHIRLISSGAWAQQGRASIQASHGLERSRSI